MGGGGFCGFLFFSFLPPCGFTQTHTGMYVLRDSIGCICSIFFFSSIAQAHTCRHTHTHIHTPVIPPHSYISTPSSAATVAVKGKFTQLVFFTVDTKAEIPFVP